MEVQFHKSVCPCLETVICQTQSTEQTQEIRLPDSLPDVGRILGCWGQFILRGKEWRGNGMSVTGGVMAWVLYAPEDESRPQVVDCWIPIQLKWDFPQTQRDGAICAVPVLKGVDARSVSARKLMVRAAVSIKGKATEPVDKEVYTQPSVPGDVQILKRSYPLEIPQEAGEKPFQLEEELIFPSSMPVAATLLRYQLFPRISEYKVLAGRLVFRGSADLHIFYMADDGSVHRWNWELPFSQYTELDRDYGSGATASIQPIVTNLELDRTEDGKWLLKAGISAQYTIFDRLMMELAQDAYSPYRNVEVQIAPLAIPVRLDECSQTMKLHKTAEVQAQKVLDTVWYPDDPIVNREDSLLHIQIPGQFHVLYRDEDGVMQSKPIRSEQEITIPSHGDNMTEISVEEFPKVSGEVTADGILLTGETELQLTTYDQQGVSMIQSLVIGEETQPDPHRPSLILRRAGDGDLWQLAKSCGSTVSAIMSANDLADEPPAGQMLLIPVI